VKSWGCTEHGIIQADAWLLLLLLLLAVFVWCVCAFVGSDSVGVRVGQTSGQQLECVVRLITCVLTLSVRIGRGLFCNMPSIYVDCALRHELVNAAAIEPGCCQLLTIKISAFRTLVCLLQQQQVTVWLAGTGRH
jgi:hypothetical protein